MVSLMTVYPKRMAASVLSLFVVITFSYGQSKALICYKCTDVQAESGEESRFKFQVGLRDPNCESNPSKTMECNAGESCAFFSGPVTKAIPLMGIMKAHVVSRRCARSTAGEGCYNKEEIEKGVFDQLKSLLKEGTVKSARVCFCNTDRCNANICVGGFKILQLCIRWWQAALVVGGMLIVLFAICCLCRCCLCRS